MKTIIVTILNMIKINVRTGGPRSYGVSKAQKSYYSQNRSIIESQAVDTKVNIEIQNPKKCFYVVLKFIKKQN